MTHISSIPLIHFNDNKLFSVLVMDESEYSSVVTSAIAEVLKDLSPTVLQTVVDTLTSLGATSPEDFKYVQESDLLPALRPIQARKLVSASRQISKYISSIKFS